MGGTWLKKFIGMHYHPTSAFFSRLQLIFIVSYLSFLCYPFYSPLATISLGLDYSTWWNDPGFSPKEPESLVTLLMTAAYGHLLIKLGSKITRDTPVDHLSTKHITPLFKRRLITSYRVITSNSRAAPFLLCWSQCIRTLIGPGNSLCINLMSLLLPGESIHLLRTRPLILWSPEF